MKSPENIVFWMTLYGFSGSLSLSYLGYKRSFMDFFEKWTTFIVVYYSQTFFCKGALFSWTILSYLVPMSGQKVAVFLGFVCILYFVFKKISYNFMLKTFWIADILFNTNKNPKNEIANNNKVNIIVYQ